MLILNTMLMSGRGLSLHLVLVRHGLEMVGFPGVPFEHDVYCCLVLALGPYIAAQEGVQPQLYADNLKCLSRDPGVLWLAARFTTDYVRLVVQEPAPSKCVLLSTSREVRRDIKDWVLSDGGDKWSVRFDVRDLGGHLDTTFRGWSSTLAARVRLVISRLVLIFALPLDFHGRVRVVRTMYLLASGLRKLRSSMCRVVWSRRQLMLVLSFACWMGLLGVTLFFVLLGSGLGCFVGIFLFGLLRLVGFIASWRWLVRVALGMVLSIFSLPVLLRLVSVGSSCSCLVSAWFASA